MDADSESSALGTSEEVAKLIADTLIDHGFFDKSRFADAVASVTWELDCQHGMGRIKLKAPESTLPPG
jgi:hypothetical protein